MAEQLALQPIDYAHEIVEAASEMQAVDIVLLDVHDACDFADYFVIMTAESNRQMRALQDDIQQAMKLNGLPPHHVEGTRDSGWILLDFGDVIAHLMGPDEREFYDLEAVWPAAVELLRLQ
ncbi:MAG TPA: ribosome silencing factor [Dehalococcoidia bacterium]|nr:ribosome silencing factor [Dehalococcoidia bacterium]